jgi:hypothetical protein
VSRLLRAPLILLYAGLWGFGSYALGFVLLDDDLSVALGVAFVGGLAVGWQLGGLTSRPWPIVLGIPLAVGALVTGVYAVATHRMIPAARFSAACLAGYVLLLGLGGATSDAATRRRFRRHMMR